MKLALALAVLIFAVPTRAMNPVEGKIDPDCEKVLAPAAVGKALNTKKNVTLVPYDPMKGAGGHCNYAAGGQLLVLLMVDSGGPAKFGKQKQRKEYKDQKAVPGVGDEAFSSSAYSNILVARKGDRVLTLSSFVDPSSGDSLLKTAQLAAIAKAALKKS